MIKNKQVNVWRGDQVPPTLYHLWLKDETQLLKYDEELKDWIVFLDSNQIKKIITDFQSELDDTLNATINGYPVREGVTLTAADIYVLFSGNYVKQGDSTNEALKKLDQLLTTKVYEQ